MKWTAELNVHPPMPAVGATTIGEKLSFTSGRRRVPGRRDWTTIGVALKRRNDEPGYSIKLNTLPISKDWDGGLVLVPPYQEADEPQDD